MSLATRPVLVSLVLAAVVAAFAINFAGAAPKAGTYWNVEEVRAGMKGDGRTVMKGTKVETFQVEVLGVLRNTSPGRDLVLCRLSGLGLEKTGVIAGMSGSPVYLDGKLLGAVSYAWAYGKEPIAGVTPFSQMYSFVEAYERRDVAEQSKPNRVGLGRPVQIGGQSFDAITVSEDANAEPAADDGPWLRPLRTPLAASGFTEHSLKLLRERCGAGGLVPVQGGSAAAQIAEDEKGTLLEPGGPLAVSLISGDFDLSGIGTVTHIDGNRVYGWGHPFMSLGGCEFPLMTGWIHTIYPRQTVSFKMGSPLQTVGVINADVSTGIAGWIGRKPDLLPVRMTVALAPKGAARTFNVRVVRQRALLPTLVFTALTNSVDMEGELPEEMTADLTARIELEGHEPLVLKDTFSGFTGGRAPAALYSPVAAVLQMLAYNPYQPVRVTRVECETEIESGRRTAEIEAVELNSDTFTPGETIKATVRLRPYKGEPRRVPVELKLPSDVSEGSYAATVCDDMTRARLALHDDPTLANPRSTRALLDAVQLQLGVKRTNLVLRVPIGATGVAVGGTSLPKLPASMVQVLGNGRRTGAQPVGEALTARQPTDWVIQGTETVHFTVAARKRTPDDKP
jgi:SpoIVB peptidase S55